MEKQTNNNLVLDILPNNDNDLNAHLILRKPENVVSQKWFAHGNGTIYSLRSNFAIDLKVEKNINDSKTVQLWKAVGTVFNTWSCLLTDKFLGGSNQKWTRNAMNFIENTLTHQVLIARDGRLSTHIFVYTNYLQIGIKEDSIIEAGLPTHPCALKIENTPENYLRILNYPVINNNANNNTKSNNNTTTENKVNIL